MKTTKHRVIRNILIDMICAGIALVVFALFHHVLPREQQSVGIVIQNPYKTEAPAGNGSSLALPEDTIYIASASVSDSGLSLSAARNSRGNQNGFGRGGGMNGMSGKGGSALSESGDVVEETDDTPIAEIGRAHV